MATNASFEDQTKKIITSLIVSVSTGITVLKLRCDYNEFVGEDIPFRKLGFSSLEQYLLSIPETCRLKGSGNNALVVPVITEKNQHINEMVLKQKPAKVKWGPKRPCGVYSTEKKPPRVTAPPCYKHPSNRELPPRFNPVNRPSVSSHTNYKNTENSGCSSLSGDQRSQNRETVPRLVADVGPPPTNFELMDPLRGSLNPIRVPETANSFSGFTRGPKHILESRFNPQTQQLAQPLLNPPPATEPVKGASISSFPHSEESRWEVLEAEEEKMKPTPNSGGYNPVQRSSFDDLDSEDEFLFFYEEFHYVSDEEDLDSALENLEVSSKNEGKEQTFTVFHPDELRIPQEHESRVSDGVKKKLRQLIMEHPDGIWCSKLLPLYFEKYHQRLEPLEFGFQSVIQLCDDLPDVFHCIRPNRTDWKLYDKQKPVPDLHTMRDFSRYLQTLASASNSATNNTEPPLPDNFLDSSTNFKYPEDVVHPNETIRKQWLMNNEEPNDFVHMIVAQVYDPSKFWIQLKGPKTSTALATLMENMQIFYVHNAASLVLNEFSVCIGLFCAALFMNEYHRAVIIKVFDDQTIKVFYIDYGTIGEVPLRKTCFLHRDFSDLPQQAIRARLANIIPKEQNTMWPRAATTLMLQLVMEKDLVGNIRAIDFNHKILDLIVTDTNIPDVDIHINDVLIEKDYAVVGCEARICESSSAIVPNVHLYPAFEELENGIYPSFNDVTRLLKLGHSYEMIFHGYFAPSYSTPPFLVVPSSSTQSHPPSSLRDQPLTPAVFIESQSNRPDVEELLSTSVTSEEDQSLGKSQGEEESPEVREPDVSKTEAEIPETCLSEESTEVGVTSDSEPFVRVKKPPPGFEHVQPRFSPFRELQASFSEPQSSYSNVVQQFFHNAALNQGLNLPPVVQPLAIPVPMVDPLMMMVNSPVVNQLMYNQLAAQVANEYREMEKVRQLAALFCEQQMQGHIPGELYHQQTVTESGPEIINCTTASSTTTLVPSGKTGERLVKELNINGCIIHVLKINEELNVVSQEIVTNLLGFKSTLTSWLQSNSLDLNSFPSKIINVLEHSQIYDELRRYSIPGVYPPNNLGCNIRLTPLNDVVEIVKRYGKLESFPDLENTVKKVFQVSALGKRLVSSD